MFPSRLPGSSQAPFRFGNQTGLGQPSQVSQPPSADEFPPLRRNANGDIGQERSSNLISSMGFPTSQPASGPSLRPAAGNGLLSMLNASNRAPETRSPSAVGPPGSQRPQEQKAALDDELRPKPMPELREESSQPRQASLDTKMQATENRNPHGAIGNDAPSAKAKEEAESSTSEVQDPLSGMSETDKFSFKGLRALMNGFSDYQALVTGIDPHSLGLDWTSQE